jgi:hypothetical protein
MTPEQPKPLEVDTQSIVKDSWFKKYLYANASWPSCHVGIRIYMSEQILEDPAESWTQLAQSHFSEAQAKHLAETMSKIHRKKGIMVVPEGHQQGYVYRAKDSDMEFYREESTIAHERIYNLWNSAVNLACSTALAYVVSAENTDSYSARQEYQSISREGHTNYVGRIDGFFNNAENYTHVERYANIIRTAAATLKSPEGRKISRQYRSLLDLGNVHEWDKKTVLQMARTYKEVPTLHEILTLIRHNIKHEIAGSERFLDVVELDGYEAPENRDFYIWALEQAKD